MQVHALGGNCRGLFLALFLGTLTACGGAGGSNGVFEPLDHDVPPPSPGTFLGEDGAGTPPDTPLPRPPLFSLASFQPAQQVFGQADFQSGLPNRGAGASEVTLSRPLGICVGDHLWIADASNLRIVRHPLPTLATGSIANFVLGQKDYQVTTPGVTPGRFAFATDVAVYGDQIFVADRDNNRVLIWTPKPNTNGAIAQIVVGQPDFVSTAPGIGSAGLSGPTGIHVADGKLFVADSFNHRVLVWDTIPTTNGARADRVLGQPDFGPNVPGVTASTMDKPFDVWSNGTRVVVTDPYNYRVLIWRTLPEEDGAPADVVLGQEDFTSRALPQVGTLRGHTALGSVSLGFAGGVDSNGTQLVVADGAHNRVLVWELFPTSHNAQPTVVLGQSTLGHTMPNDDNQNHTEDPGPTNRTLSNPLWVHISGKQLFVSDYSNSRILLFE